MNRNNPNGTFRIRSHWFYWELEKPGTVYVWRSVNHEWKQLGAIMHSAGMDDKAAVRYAKQGAKDFINLNGL